MIQIMVSINFPRLKSLDLSGCSFQGSIPASFGQWTTLSKLDLSNNNLISTIPSELGLLSDLTYLGLAGNDMNGTIPEELGGLLNLTTFVADNNTGLESNIPEGFCKDDRLQLNHLSTNWCWSVTECCST